MEFDPVDVEAFISEQLLGQTDGFAQFFRGRIPKDNAYGIEPREVLIKVSRRRSRGEINPVTETDLKSQFHNELKLRRLKHKNIVHLIGFSEAPEQYYLILEMSHGKLLSDIISDLTWENMLSILIGIASGITYLHTHPEGSLVQSNICSSSIFITEDHIPKIIDFRFCLEEGNKRTGGAAGYYHALEQNCMATKDCDTFAFGVLALQLVTKDSRIGFVDRGLDGSFECRHIVQRYVPKFKESGNLVDLHAYGHMAHEAVKVSEVIIKCLGKDNKPSMEDVFKDLRLLRLRRKLVGSSSLSALRR